MGLIQMVAAGPNRPPRSRSRLSKRTLSLKNVRPPVLMFLPLLLGAVAASGQNTQILEGRTIQRIDFDPATQPLPRDELDRLLPLRAGSALR